MLSPPQLQKDNANSSADGDREKVENVFQELMPQIGEKPNQRVIDAEDDCQYAPDNPGRINPMPTRVPFIKRTNQSTTGLMVFVLWPLLCFVRS